MREPEYRILTFYNPQTKQSSHVPQRKFLNLFWWDIFRKCETWEEAESVVVLDSAFTWEDRGYHKTED